MAAKTLNVSMTEDMIAFLGAEARSMGYTSTSEVVRESVRERMKRKIQSDLHELEKAHAGAQDRDTSDEEEQAILRIQRKVRSEMRAEAAKGARS